MVDDARVVLMTTPDRETAERLATMLVEERVAACANILPGVTSVYRWEGAVERDEEILVVLKTPVGRIDMLVDRAVELHPYDVPEVLALPVTEGHGPYVQWVRESTETNREDSGAGGSG